MAGSGIKVSVPIAKKERRLEISAAGRAAVGAKGKLRYATEHDATDNVGRSKKVIQIGGGSTHDADAGSVGDVIIGRAALEIERYAGSGEADVSGCRARCPSIR